MYEDGRTVDIIYLDFQKAFDQVLHRKLLNKVESHGISDHIHRWISDWHCNCKQRVVLNGKSQTSTAFQVEYLKAQYSVPYSFQYILMTWMKM